MSGILLNSDNSQKAQLFTFSEQLGKIRIVMRNDEPWFVAKDVAACIEHSNVTKMCEHCRDKDKIVVDVEELKTNDLQVLGNRGLTVVSESGLYRILARCNLPKCEPFENWVFGEVLPSIRKTGSYSTSSTLTTEQQLLLKAFNTANDPVAFGAVMKERDEYMHRTELKRSMTAIGKLGGISKARNIAIRERDEAREQFRVKQAELRVKQDELDTVNEIFNEYKESIGEGEKWQSSSQLIKNYPKEFRTFTQRKLTIYLKGKGVTYKMSEHPDKSGYKYAIFDAEQALSVIRTNPNKAE